MSGNVRQLPPLMALRPWWKMSAPWRRTRRSSSLCWMQRPPSPRCGPASASATHAAGSGRSPAQGEPASVVAAYAVTEAGAGAVDEAAAPKLPRRCAAEHMNCGCDRGLSCLVVASKVQRNLFGVNACRAHTELNLGPRGLQKVAA